MTETPGIQSVPIPNAIHGLDCFRALIGPWAIQPEAAHELAMLVEEGDVEEMVEKAQMRERPSLMERSTIIDNTAIVPIRGSITKGKSTLGGTSTVELRRVIDSLSRDDDMDHIVLHVDSPGGKIAGVEALARDVRNIANDPDKPNVVSVIDDLGASAAYWIAAQANRVVATSRTTEVGSIGVRVVVKDTHERMEERGVEVVTITTGDRKDDFVRGTEIDEETIAHRQGQIESMNDIFIEDIAAGRGVDPAAIRKLATGETFLAEEALNKGLIDDIVDLETVLRNLPSSEEVNATVNGSGDGAEVEIDYDELAASLAERLTNQKNADIPAENIFDHAHLDEPDLGEIDDGKDVVEELPPDLEPYSAAVPEELTDKELEAWCACIAEPENANAVYAALKTTWAESGEAETFEEFLANQDSGEGELLTCFYDDSEKAVDVAIQHRPEVAEEMLGVKLPM